MAEKITFGRPGDTRQWVACASQTAERLADGRYPPGDVLPPVAKISAETGQSASPARRALDHLRAAGLVNQAGNGRYRAPARNEAAAAAPHSEPEPGAGEQDSREAFLRREQYLSVAELAACVHASKATIYRVIQAGELPGVIRPSGRTLRIPVRSARQWLAKAVLDPGQLSLEDLAENEENE